MSESVGAGLAAILGADAVSVASAEVRPYLQDASEVRGLTGTATAVAKPSSSEEVARVLAFCYEHGIAITPRGGGTGYAGGAVPHGGVVLSLERLRAIRSFDPLLWRAEVEAGVTTAHLRRLARENGLVFPPDPGAAEQSQIGGNVATNAGGPHAFKYGVTGAWVTGLEAVLPPGEIVRVGGSIRKDVAGYDLRSLLIGSEGTLGLITSVSVRFIPAPEARRLVVAAFADEASGCQGLSDCLASGTVPAALEYLDADAVAFSRPSFPGSLPESTRFVVIAEADGSEPEAAAGMADLVAVLAPDALEVTTFEVARGIDELWAWRDGVGMLADAVLGGKVSEDIVVPIDRLAEAIAATREVGARHGVRSCSWGHGGDGNLHSSFLFERGDAAARGGALAAADDLFGVAVDLGGSISGEHGLGEVKNGQLRRQWDGRSVELHRDLKRLFDPKGLLNPGKKEP